MRALSLCLEERSQRAVQTEQTCISWLMRHSAWCVTRSLGEAFCRTSRDGEEKRVHMRGGVLGETSWARAHGRRDKAGKLVRTVSDTCQERSQKPAMNICVVCDQTQHDMETATHGKLEA